MLALKVNNVNEALPLAIHFLNTLDSVREVPSRDGPVREFAYPVCTTYLRPDERVLMEPLRDANPFFHFMEGLWILAGRKDVAWISEFNSNIKNYSDDGETFHGAYGDRLRNLKRYGANDIDQIEEVIAILRKDPYTRRAVLQIWDSHRDLMSQDHKKDIPCNTLIMFKVRSGRLDMTIANRSNDLIWGCYGANAVHFSMLHEYIAARSGYGLGVYNQISDSLHVYTNRPQWEALRDLNPASTVDPYKNEVSPFPMFDPACKTYGWNEDLLHFMEAPFDNLNLYRHPFFLQVAVPMLVAWRAHKEHGNGLYHVKHITATDWRKACREWLKRRELNV